MCVCMYVCIIDSIACGSYVCMHVCMYVCVYLCKSCMYVCNEVSMYACMYVCIIGSIACGSGHALIISNASSTTSDSPLAPGDEQRSVYGWGTMERGELGLKIGFGAVSICVCVTHMYSRGGREVGWEGERERERERNQHQCAHNTCEERKRDTQGETYRTPNPKFQTLNPKPGARDARTPSGANNIFYLANIFSIP